MAAKNIVAKAWAITPSSDGKRWSAWPAGDKPAVSGVFPLTVSTNGRYVQQADTTPFLVLGDTPWCLANNCTNAQIDSYLTDRAAKGCTGIMFEAVERGYGNQSPLYRNTDGNDPFTVMSPVNWVINNAYWTRVDYIVDQCKARGMVCFIAPAYTGYGNGGDGWLGNYSGVSDATLQTYGAALANRYTQGNVVWLMGGDDANDAQATGAYGAATPQRTKQWQIIVGIRSVRTTDLVTGHTARNTGGGATDGEAWLAWNNGFTGFNLNNTYGTDGTADMPALASTAFGRSGPLPFFMIEAGYENTDTENTNSRVPALQSFFRGGLVGMFDGHDALWHFGNLAPNNSGAASVISTYLAPSWTSYQYIGNLLRAYAWHLLVPKTDTSLVTTALGTGSTAICPARASDGSFAMIFTNGVNFTVDMTALTPGSVRARWYNASAGTYSTASGSPFANTGTQAFTAPGERVLVLDAA